MKKPITLSCLMLFSVVVWSQTPLVITSADIPVPNAVYNTDNILSSSPGAPTLGDNQTWDYSSNFSNVPSSVNYIVETDPFFTSQGIDVYLNTTKAFTTSFFYSISWEWDFNSTGQIEKGLYVYPQAYSLEPFTGNNMDSITMPVQGYILSSPRIISQVPYTANSSWHSTSHRETDFFLTVASAGLNKTPGQHVYDYVRNDTIVGWGKLSVHTSGGPSIQYDVLMDQVSQWAVDSFYLNGSPAPPTLLNAFGVTQGQITDAQYYYNFHRAGTFFYLLRFYYGSDDTFTTPVAVFLNTDNLETVSVSDAGDISYSSLVFPNPANDNEINVKIMGQTFSVNEYHIIDMSGRAVQVGTISTENGDLLKVTLNNNLANGNYLLKITDKTNKEIVSEKINIQR